MGCIYNSNGIGIDAGVCSLWDEDAGVEIAGVFDDPNGYCGADDDPDPSYSCDHYESDYYCFECGIDLNVEECDCD